MQTRKVLVTKLNATKSSSSKRRFVKLKGQRQPSGYGVAKTKKGAICAFQSEHRFVFVANTGLLWQWGLPNFKRDPGCVELQADDIYRNITVAKATEPIVWAVGEKSRKISVIYLGGYDALKVLQCSMT